MGVLSVWVETPSAVFGLPLSHLRKRGQMRQGLPLALTHMVQFLDRHALTTRGLFRVSGDVKTYQDLRKRFDNGGFPEFDIEDIPSVASLLKLFLRELPGGLIPEPHGKQMLKVFKDSTDEERNPSIRTILNTLPEEHLNVLSHLLFFLSRVAGESHQNLMTSKNLSAVFGPNIFHVPVSPTMLEEQLLYNTLTLHLLDNVPHLVPNMYPQASTISTAEEDNMANEECGQHLPLEESRSKLSNTGRLGKLRQRLRGFWRELCSCAYSSDRDQGDLCRNGDPDIGQ